MGLEDSGSTPLLSSSGLFFSRFSKTESLPETLVVSIRESPKGTSTARVRIGRSLRLVG